MIQMFLKSSIRSIWSDPVCSLVNCFGLSLGAMSCAFLWVYITHNLTYDHYHENLREIYRINTTWTGGDTNQSMAITVPGLGTALAKDYPLVAAYACISAIEKDVIVQYDHHDHTFQNIRAANADILNVFTFHFIHGDQQTALREQNQLILNETSAKKLFGTIHCIGEIVVVKDIPRKVVGVFEDLPQNVDLPISGVMNETFPDNWEMFAFHTYVKTSSPDQHQLDQALLQLSEEHFGGSSHPSEQIIMQAQPLKEVHLAKAIMGDQPKGNRVYIFLTLAAGLVLALIVLINISNLGAIKALDETRQQGIRQVLGASPTLIISQSLCKLALLYGISCLLGLTFIQMFATTFYELTNIHLKFDEHWKTMASFALVFFLLVLIAGGINSLIFIKVRPMNALKNQLNSRLSNDRYRKALVVFQFLVTIITLSTLLILSRQWSFIQATNLGFDRNTMIIYLPKDNPKLEPVVNALAYLLGEHQISMGSWGATPGADVPFTTASISNNGQHINIQSHAISCDKNFLEVLNIPLVQGHLPSSQHQEILINQTLADMLDKPLEANISLPWLPDGKVVGIIRDYHYQSLHTPLAPLILVPQLNNNHMTHIYLKGACKQQEAIQAILEENWGTGSYQIRTLNEEMMDNYPQEQEALYLLSYFAGLSLFISLLGLFGILVYLLKKRLFEIGIRKVLGAGFYDLMGLFGKEIIISLAISSGISLPISWFIRLKVFDLYAYKTNLSAWMFLVPIAAVIMASCLLISYQIYRASKKNPARILHQE